MSTLAIIPARGGSKGIPRKNMRLMNGKPLIAYAIENALNSQFIDTVVVSSDSEEILSFASQYDGVIALNRNSKLAQDAVTLDPVIHDACLRAEEMMHTRFDATVTLQPTSPLLTVATLDKALKTFNSSEVDTIISVVNNPHLRWKKDRETNKVKPDYKTRLNRQQLPPSYAETGAFLITRREFLTKDSRLGNNISVFEVPEQEATDIDTRQDWLVCESLLARKTLVFRVDGYKELGLGHVYRALTLGYEFIEHDVIFICNSAHREGIETLSNANMKVVEIANDEELFSWLATSKPDIYVHDCLDTNTSFIEQVKRHVKRVVTFEDLGDGARKADAVVNAIYEGASPHSNVYTGKRYVALRDEFFVSKPKAFSENVEYVLVMFGGSDPLDLSSRVYKFAQIYNNTSVQVQFDFILGPAYANENLKTIPEKGIRVIHNVVRVSDYMKKADIAFSSQGRTTFELASMGVPTIVLAQNSREQLHTFAQMNNGFINLGLGSEVSDEDIKSTFEWLVSATSIRKEMRRLMLANNLKSGIKRVKRIILGEVE